MLGKPIAFLEKIETLRIPIENFAVGEIVDTVGVSVAITVNGVSFYDFDEIKKGALLKAHIKHSKDTLVYNVSDIFNNPKEKIKSLIDKKSNL